MKAINADLLDRNNSIERLYQHIVEVSEQRGKVEVIVVLKASFYIALYNNIEATVYAVLERIHEEARNQSYIKLSEKIQHQMIEYTFGKSKQSELHDKEIVDAEIKSIISKDKRFPLIHEFLKRKTIFSGNLDARKLKEIAEKYGIPLNDFTESTQPMLTVKNMRNKIAHGEVSLSDAGKGLKNKQILDAFNTINSILNEFITSAEYFIEKELYLANGKSEDSHYTSSKD